MEELTPLWELVLLKCCVPADRAWPGEECRIAPTDKAEISFLRVMQWSYGG